MSYYSIRVIGVVCDDCGASEEDIPLRPNALRSTRRTLAKSGWSFWDGKDRCRECSANSVSPVRSAAPRNQRR